jgi:hypothetical protein
LYLKQDNQLKDRQLQNSSPCDQHQHRSGVASLEVETKHAGWSARDSFAVAVLSDKNTLLLTGGSEENGKILFCLHNTKTCLIFLGHIYNVVFKII